MDAASRPAKHSLLAPAGSLAAAEAALGAGADAVYAGARGWSRGGPALGLAPRDMARAAALCRRAGGTFQAAFNTIPGASEVPAFLAALRRCRDDGVAAVILNDPGTIALVRGEFPSLRICASVGVSTLNPEDALFYREVGADAIVLPTAVTWREVPAIRERGGLAIEAFIRCRPEILLHGKCGLSGYLFDAAGPAERPDIAGGGTPSSAKRGGRCFLACRGLPLSREPHAIDEELPRWVAAGVDVFKIQGRELGPRALADLVPRLRARLDAAIRNPHRGLL